MELLDGKKTSLEIQNELGAKVKKLVKKGGTPPHLAAILVGEDGPSRTYVNAKVKACEKIGFKSTLHKLNADVSQSELLKLIDTLNRDNSIDGFMYRLAGEEFLYKIDMTSFNTTLVSNSLYDSGASGHALYFNGIDFISLSQYICTMSSLGQQTDCNEVDLDFKGILPSNITSISEIKDSPKRLVKVLDLLGRETKIKNNMLLIYQYSDGSSEKIFKIGE